MIEIRPGRFVSRIFYGELHRDGVNFGNILAMVFRDDGEDFWRMTLRVRGYVDGDLTEKSKDVKETFDKKASPDHSLADLLPGIRTMFDAAGAEAFEEIIVESANPEVVMARLTAQPWAHASGPLTKEQLNARLQRE